MRQFFKNFVHNVIVHPLMMILPNDLANKTHDMNANWAFGADTRLDELGIEQGEIVFIVSTCPGHNTYPKLPTTWTSLVDAVAYCEDPYLTDINNPQWVTSFIITEQKLNSGDKGKNVYSKIYCKQSQKWLRDFL